MLSLFWRYLARGFYLTFKSIFYKALNLILVCEIMLESVPGTNQY